MPRFKSKEEYFAWKAEQKRREREGQRRDRQPLDPIGTPDADPGKIAHNPAISVGFLTPCAEPWHSMQDT